MALNIHKQSPLSSFFLYTLLVSLHQSSTVSAVPIGLDNEAEKKEEERKNIVQFVIIMVVVTAVLATLLAGWSGIKWFMRRRANKIQNQTDLTNPKETSRLTPLETIDLTPPSPSHMKSSRLSRSSRSSRYSDTWERYLSMIQSPSRLNQAVKSMKSQNPGRWSKIKEDTEEDKFENF